MKKKIKRYLSTALAITMISTTISPTVFPLLKNNTYAAPIYEGESFEIGGGIYWFEKSTGTITGYEGPEDSEDSQGPQDPNDPWWPDDPWGPGGLEKPGLDIEIPSTIDGVQVEKIGDEAFKSKNLGSIIIPEGIKTLGTGAFAWNNKIQNLSIPSSITNIGDMAFAHINLRSLVIGQGVKTIGKDAFIGSQVKTLILPPSLTDIGEGAFSQNYELTSLVIPEGVITIGNRAFEHNYELKTLVLPKSLINMGDEAFNLSQRLTSVTYKGLIPPKHGTEVYKTSNININISVPLTSIELYKEELGLNISIVGHEPEIAPDVDIVSEAKIKSWNAIYSNMAQEIATSEAVIEYAIKETATAAVNNENVTIIINKVGYTESEAGTSSTPTGTDGSYVFSITVSKGEEIQTTEQKTITITATKFTGITDIDAVAAAKSAIVNGTVNVGFGSTQETKTAAVQTYVNGLLTEDALGVTATVSYNSETEKYDISISKGSVEDTKTIGMTINESSDPNIQIVNDAKAKSEQASYLNMTQEHATSELVIEDAIKATATTAVNNESVTITINKSEYIAPISGTSSNPNGTYGSYTFSVTVSKGNETRTTEEKTITIKAKSFTGTTDVQAVSAAKSAIVDGTVNVGFEAKQEAKTVAVQSYVNGLLVEESKGVIASVSYNTETGKYDVAISKGNVSDTKTIEMTVIELSDPNIKIVIDAKENVENTNYEDIEEIDGTAEEVEAYIKSEIKTTAATAVNNEKVTITINKSEYIAPISGTSSNPSGTDGSYTFSVTLSKGKETRATEEKTITIKAKNFTGTTDVQAVSAAKSAIVDGTVNVEFGATQETKTQAVQSYVNGLMTEESTGVIASVSYNTETGKYDVAISKGNVSDTKTIEMTVIELSDPNIKIVNAAKENVESIKHEDWKQADSKDEDMEKDIESGIKAKATTAVNNEKVTITINKVEYVAPISGTSSNPNGTDGSYTFSVTVKKGKQEQTTDQKKVTIKAKKFIGTTDVVAVEMVKEAIVSGTLNKTVKVGFESTQETKTAAVQSYVNGLIAEQPTGLTGVRAEVAYNSATKKYDVTITKGNISEIKTIEIIIEESKDPNIETVTEIKTKLEEIKYTDIGQIDGTTEEVDIYIESEIKAKLNKAIDDSGVTSTINKVEYVAPISGTSSNPNGTDGSYTFSVTIKKGKQEQTTDQKKVTIKAKKFTGLKVHDIIGAVKDINGKIISQANVKIIRGQDQIGQTVKTDDDGKFIIKGIKDGNYNLVVSKDDRTVTSIIILKGSDYVAGTIKMPIGKTNSIIDIKPGTPAIVVGKLDRQFLNTSKDNDKGITKEDNEVVKKGGSVEIKLIAEKKDSTVKNSSDIFKQSKLNGKSVGIFMDLSLLKTVKDEEGVKIDKQSTTLTELTDLIEVLIPLPMELRNQSEYVVYRYHNNSVDSISITANKDGEKIELVDNNTTIKLTTKKFSTYAIAYKESKPTPIPTPTPTPIPTPTPTPTPTKKLEYDRDSAEVFYRKVKQDRYKEWIINFNRELLQGEYLKENVHVVDENGFIQKISFKLGEDKKSIIIKAPREGYYVGKTYTLVIKGVKDTLGNTIQGTIIMDFKVENDMKNKKLDYDRLGAKLLNKRENQDKYKDWSLKFSKDILQGDYLKDSIHVVDEKGFIQDISLKVGTDKKTIMINSPKLGYESEKTYTLVIKGIKDIEGSEIVQTVIMDFTVID